MKNGIIAAGNWIIDKVKFIDILPQRNMLANISDEVMGLGGGPHNVLVDLAKMNIGIPLAGAGIIGNDADGDYILKVIKEHNIDTKHIQKTIEKGTSYTDVMSVKNSGDRTFFHYRGANATLDYEHFVNINTEHKIFYLAYLLLLDKLDSEDKEYGVVAAKVLNLLQKKGYKTTVDVVSEQSDRFRKIVNPCLPYIDYLILNEIEAGTSTGFQIRKQDNSIDPVNIHKAAEALINGGVKEWVIIHFPEGGFAIDTKKNKYFVPSFLVEQKDIVSSVGAGDAFCAGALYGLHEGLPIEQILKIANASARFNLFGATTTDGAVSIGEIKKYLETARQREPVVKL